VVFFTAVNIRKFVVRASRLSELVDLQSLTPSTALFLEASVRAGLNLLVSGGTSLQKATDGASHVRLPTLKSSSGRGGGGASPVESTVVVDEGVTA